MRVGLYGGMFDPIHVGHLTLALALKESAGLDEVWFCPASCSPHKRGSDALPAAERLQMVRLAVDPIPDCRVIKIEVDRPPPSYTIDTVRELAAAYPDYTFHLLLGSDALDRLDEWAHIEELLELAPPLVGRRTAHFTIPERIKEKIRYIETPLLEVSSTDLRPRLRKGEYCGHLIPSSSYQYLIENELYL